MFRVPLWSNWREVRSPSTRWKRNNFPMGCNGQRYLCGNGEEEGRVTEIFGHWTAAQVSNEEKNSERIFAFLYLTFRINLYLHIFFHNIYKAMLNFKFKKSKVNGCHSIWVKSSDVLDPDLQRKDTTFRKEEIKRYIKLVDIIWQLVKICPQIWGKYFFDILSMYAACFRRYLDYKKTRIWISPNFCHSFLKNCIY